MVLLLTVNVQVETVSPATHQALVIEINNQQVIMFFHK